MTGQSPSLSSDAAVIARSGRRCSSVRVDLRSPLRDRGHDDVTDRRTQTVLVAVGAKGNNAVTQCLSEGCDEERRLRGEILLEAPCGVRLAQERQVLVPAD